MPADEIWFVIVNCPSRECAEAIGKGAIGQGLVQSVNISAEMATAYVWEGRVVDNREFQAMFKVPAKNREALFAYAKAHHPFETPAIVAWPVGDAEPDYRKYILGG